MSQTNAEGELAEGQAGSLVAEWHRWVRECNLDAIKRLMRRLIYRRFQMLFEDAMQRIEAETDMDRLEAAALQIPKLWSLDEFQL
jgi:hypothetical protein